MIYSVIVDISNSQVDRVFDYTCDSELKVGQRVEVQFAHRNVEGFVVGRKETSDCPPEKLKSIYKCLDDFTVFDEKMLQLGEYMCRKYHLRLIDVLRLFLPPAMRGNRVRVLSRKQATISSQCALTLEDMLEKCSRAPKQQQLLGYIAQHGATLSAKLSEKFGSSALKSLVDKGLVTEQEIVVKRTPYSGVSGNDARHTLTPSQQSVVNSIMAETGQSFLLHGVTGSGKTEVYMNVIEQVVNSGKTCIMLVPEISLTPNMLRLFRNRFGDCVAILHSGLSAGERFDEWMRLREGEAKIAIGARSAVFAPLDNIGIIIIDEEHDSSYISDFNPRYNTIDVAKYRCSQYGSTLVLGSATPSLESFLSAQRGELTLLSLPERINKRPLPTVEIADMAMERRKGNKGLFSELLRQRLSETIEKGNQAILFLNRRGYSSFLMCTKCGYVARCSDCDVTLTVHREDNELKCHYCNKRYKMLTNCPECGSNAFRQGKIGTQQVVEMLNKMYPDVKVLRMDADTTQNKESHVKILSAFANQQAQILVGTQMIAKGHDFPNVTLVGILDGDQSLYYSDYLATERTFQLLTQVAGRSGRDTQPGRVVLQTYTPNHYCLQLATRQDYLGFYKREINLREASLFPPFSTIVRILYSGENEKDCITQLTKHFNGISALKQQYEQDFLYLDKMRCPLKRAEKKYRFQILMKLSVRSTDEILQKIYSVTDSTDVRGVTVFVERNPQNLT